MKKLINIVKKDISDNKAIYLVGLFIFFILIYTHFNTFVSNDDLPYSFFYRGNDRIVSLWQVLLNQVADYQKLNARFFVHCVLQAVLIFGKTLWSIINPLMIVTSLILILKIVKLKVKKFNNFLSILVAISCYFLVINYKWLVYWVAGSVNYVWVLCLLLLLLYLFYRYGFSKYKFINILGIALLCALHECTMAFTIIFIVGHFLISCFKNKKVDKEYFWYFLGFLGSLILFLAPSTGMRMNSDELWNSLSFLDKLLTSIPVVSKNLFNLTNIYNILPYLFILTIIINLYKNKSKLSYSLILLILINVGVIYLIDNSWLYFILTLLLLGSELYCHTINKEFSLCIFSLSMYAVIFSNILTPLYFAARPNYYFYCYMIFYIIYTLNFHNLLSFDNVKVKYLINGVVILVFSSLVVNEIYNYTQIGRYHKMRLEEMQEYKDNKLESAEPLILTKIPDRYAHYHVDTNNPTSEFFTYRYFLNYYGLPEGIEIIYK